MNFLSKLTRWYFGKKALPYWAILFIDSGIVFFSIVLVFALTHGLMQTAEVFGSLVLTAVINLVFYWVGFRCFHTYSGVLRFSSFVDLQRISLAVFLGTSLSAVFNACVPSTNFLLPFSCGELVFVFVLVSSLMWMTRVMVKSLYDVTYRCKVTAPILIYGVRQGGVSLAKSIRNQDPSHYTVAGFLTDKPEMINRMLMGVRVHDVNDPHLADVIRQKGIKGVFVSPLRSEQFRENTPLVKLLMDLEVKIFMMPVATEWDKHSKLKHTQLREVEIEDLLPRDKIEVDLKAVGQLLSGRKILITGAAGSIGSEMVRQVATFQPEQLILIDQAETPMHDVRLWMNKNFPAIHTETIVTSICNQTRMERIFAQYEPDYVLHAAAYKHVPMMEDNPSEAVQNNIYGTRVLADLAVKYGTKKFVMISTDKAVNPTNVMGCSKRICEIYVQSLDKAIKDGRVKGVTQFVTTRFGNVLGSNGSVIPLFREQLKNGGPITVTHPDIIRYFMLIPEACKLVLEAGTMGNGGEIFIFDMGKPVRIADLAKQMIRLSGAKDVEIVYTGLRDGEKLFEELLNDTEITKPTYHPKIKIASVREYDYEDAKRQEDELYRLSFTYDAMAVVKMMKRMVPEFKSQHSVYEELDK